MATIQAVLRRKPNAQKHYPVAIRITKDRKATYLFTGQYVDERFWDKKNRKIRKSHPNANRLNHLISQKLTEANDKLLQTETATESFSAGTIKKKLSHKGNLNFFFIAQKHLENLKNRNRHHQYRTELGRMQRLQEFIGKKELHILDLNVALLQRFQAYLLNERKVSKRTVVNYMILYRTIYNLAINESLVDAKDYPFGKGKIQIKLPEAHKIGLNRQELQLLENADDLTPGQQRALHVWLTSFYFAGIRVGDVLQLKWSDFQDDRLYYRMNKNSKLVSLKIPEKAKVILNDYSDKRDTKTNLVFPQLQRVNLDDSFAVTSGIQSATRNLNRHLKKIAKKVGIKKNLSMHIARHTFGNLSGDKIPIQMLQKLYRHSSVTTTIRYQANFIRKDADDALEKVIGL